MNIVKANKKKKNKKYLAYKKHTKSNTTLENCNVPGNIIINAGKTQTYRCYACFELMRAWQFNYTCILQTIMSRSETQINRRQNRLKDKSRNQLTAVAGQGESTRLKIVSEPKFRNLV